MMSTCCVARKLTPTHTHAFSDTHNDTDELSTQGALGTEEVVDLATGVGVWLPPALRAWPLLRRNEDTHSWASLRTESSTCLRAACWVLWPLLGLGYAGVG